MIVFRIIVEHYISATETSSKMASTLCQNGKKKLAFLSKSSKFLVVWNIRFWSVSPYIP